MARTTKYHRTHVGVRQLRCYSLHLSLSPPAPKPRSVTSGPHVVQRVAPVQPVPPATRTRPPPWVPWTLVQAWAPPAGLPVARRPGLRPPRYLPGPECGRGRKGHHHGRDKGTISGEATGVRLLTISAFSLQKGGTPPKQPGMHISCGMRQASAKWIHAAPTRHHY